jgi:hypothetical protein
VPSRCRAVSETRFAVPERKVSQKGVPYLREVLKRKKTVLSQAMLWEIAHANSENEIHLKVGRYKLDGKTLEAGDPKSELTLDGEEFSALMNFLSENLEPFRLGTQKWIPLDEDLGPRQVEQLKALFADPDQRRLIDFLNQHAILPGDLLSSLDHQRRCRAVAELVVSPEEVVQLVEASCGRLVG